MEFKDITNNIANMFFPGKGLEKAADKGFSDFVNVDSKKDTYANKTEQSSVQTSGVKETPKKDIVRNDMAKKETPKKDLDVKKDAETSNVVVDDEGKIEIVVENDLEAEISLLPEENVENVVEEIDEELVVAYVEPVIQEEAADVFVEASTDSQNISLEDTKVISEKIVPSDEEVIDLEDLVKVEADAPDMDLAENSTAEQIKPEEVQEFVQEELYNGNNIKESAENKNMVVPEKSKNIEIVDLDNKEVKTSSIQKMVSNDFELVKIINDENIAPEEQKVAVLDVDNSVVDLDVVVTESKAKNSVTVEDVKFEEVPDVDLTEPLVRNIFDVDEESFASDNTSNFDELIMNAPVASEVKKFDAVTDEKVSFRDAFKGLSKEVVEQVKVNITKSAVQGLSKIDIHLKPEGLGMVEVKLNIGKDGKLEANIIASRVETMEVLQKDSVVLAKSLSDAGFDMSSDNFNFSFAERESSESRKGLKEFISKTLREDVEVANNERDYISSSAVNIRV